MPLLPEPSLLDTQPEQCPSVLPDGEEVGNLNLPFPDKSRKPSWQLKIFVFLNQLPYINVINKLNFLIVNDFLL